MDRSKRCWRTPPKCPTSAIAKACSAMPPTRDRAASSRAHPHRRAGRVQRMPARRGPSRERAFAHFTRMGFRSLVMARAPRTRSPRTTRSWTRRMPCGRLRRAAGPRDGSPAGPPGRHRRDARGRRRDLVFDRTASRALHPAGRRCRPTCSDSRRSPRSHRPRVDETLAVLRPVLEDPPIQKIGHDLKFDAIVLARHGIRPRRPRDRHHAGQLSARRHARRATRSRSLLEHAGYKALSEEDVRCKSRVVPGDRGRQGAELRAVSGRTSRSSSNPRCSACSSRTGSRRGRRPRDAADPGAGRRRARRHPRRRQGVVRRIGPRRAGARETQRADLRDGRRGIQHQLAAAASRILFDKLQRPRSSATSRRRRRRPPSRCSRNWRWRTTCPG